MHSMSLPPIEISAMAFHLSVKASMPALAHKALHLSSYPSLVHFIPTTLASLPSSNVSGTTLPHSIFLPRTSFPRPLHDLLPYFFEVFTEMFLSQWQIPDHPI